MELVLQRYSWALNLAAVLLGAYFAARTVNTIAATAIAPKPALVQQAASAPQPAAAQRTELDADKVAKLFDVPRPPPETKPPPSSRAPAGTRYRSAPRCTARWWAPRSPIRAGTRSCRSRIPI